MASTTGTSFPAIDPSKYVEDFCTGTKIKKMSAKEIKKIIEELMARGIKPRDAIHAATAIENGMNETISDDPDFDRIPGLKRIPVA